MAGKDVTRLQEGAYRLLAERMGYTHVSNRKHTAATEEAARLRAETAVREAGKFGKKKGAAPTDDSDLYMDDEALTNLPVSTQGQECDASMQLNQIGTSLTGLSIMEEIQNDRNAGRVRPFVEGEPIGRIQQHVRKPAPMLMTRNEVMDERQKELRARQRRNDATLAKMLRRSK